LLKPKISKTLRGDYLVDGVKLHMRGFWQLIITLTLGGEEKKLVIPYKL
jgi:hypothetical protein